MATRKDLKHNGKNIRNRSKLKRSNQTREDSTTRQTGEATWIYGIHAVSAALANSNRNCLRLVATQNGADALACENQASRDQISTEIVQKHVLEDMLPRDVVHQGVALLTGPTPQQSVAELIAFTSGRNRTLLVALDQVTDPQNIGAVIRSAAAFGASAVIVPDRHTPQTTAALVKAASGAIETIPLSRAPNLVRALEQMRRAGFWLVGLDVDAREQLSDVQLPDKCVLIFGAENKGIRRLTRKTCDILVRIPTLGAVQSLNISATAAVTLYEWNRQRDD